MSSLLNDMRIKEIIVFGTGSIGRIAIHLLENCYHIMFAVDNDKSKWGTYFEGYIIKAPHEIGNFRQDIVIISTKYVMEISSQLCQMGISRDKIFFCDVKLIDGRNEYTFYPLNAAKVKETGKELIQYDLFGKENLKTDQKKVLIFCIFYSVYTKQLIENMSKRYHDIEFSLLTGTNEYQEKVTSDQLKHIYFFQTLSDLKTILEALPVYDAMQLLWIEWEWSYFYDCIRRKTKRLNLNVGGSDFYRADKNQKDFKKNLIECADRITAETEGTIQEFRAYYKNVAEHKVSLLPFGIEVLDLINSNKNRDINECKRKYGISLNRIVVTCGHNASDQHQHIKIISALAQLPEHIKKKIICVFPMTYPDGRNEYIRKVESQLKETGLEYVILTKFMDFHAMAEYALISDIMIHVQKTDQLSSTMLEEMYAGSIIIAGSWLPYQSLHKMGLYFLDVDAVSDVSKVLINAVTNIEAHKKKCTGNSEIIWKHSSWKELAPKWRELWG